MLRFAALCTALLFIAASAVPAGASDTCARATGGRCKVGQTAPPKPSKSSAATRKATRPIPKGNHKGRDEYTSAQREKLMERAREICRENYGAPSRVYRFDYKRNTVWCEPPSY